MSVMLINLVKQKCKGIAFSNPTGTIKSSRHIDTFLDYCTYFNNDFEAEIKGQKPQVQNDLRKAAQWWGQLLHASGGKLELTKCFFYIVDWKFDNNGQPIPENKNYRIEIKGSETNEPIQIQQKQAHESHRTLGFHMNPLLTTESSKEHLKTKASELTVDLNRNLMILIEAKLFRTSVYRPCISYTMPMT